MTPTPVALIAGITGQDGSYLAEYLLEQGYEVAGITRDPGLNLSLNLQHLEGRIRLFYSSYEFGQLIEIINTTRPTEIYDLCGQSYVSKSWSMVEETIRSIGIIPSRMLEAIVATDRSIRFLHASSSELFNPANGETLTERSPIAPYNPYGCAKAFAHNMVSAYRRTYGLHAVNAILFPHESPRRHANFVFKKIVRQAVEIKHGARDRLLLGNLDASRDWGYAPEFIACMHRMMVAAEPDDYCLCTGIANTVGEIARKVFAQLELDWERYVEVDHTLVRRYEPLVIVGSAEKAARQLGWKPKVGFDALIRHMIDYEMMLHSGSVQDYSDEHPQFD
jgi:GDPmannose 4,6-dehydratase